jgi:hypothetical protein
MIYRSIIKYGYYSLVKKKLWSNCTAEKCLEKEQYYLDLLTHEYNIDLSWISLRFQKHYEETIAKSLKNFKYDLRYNKN